MSPLHELSACAVVRACTLAPSSTKTFTTSLCPIACTNANARAHLCGGGRAQTLCISLSLSQRLQTICTLLASMRCLCARVCTVVGRPVQRGPPTIVVRLERCTPLHKHAYHHGVTSVLRVCADVCACLNAHAHAYARVCIPRSESAGCSSCHRGTQSPPCRASE